MRPAKKIATGIAALGLIFALNAKAQSTANDNRVAFNGASGAKTEVTKKRNPLTAPVVKETMHRYDAREASYDENISVIIYHGKSDSITGPRYAKGFANGFANDRATGNKPIYVTSLYVPNAHENETYVEFFVDGEMWSYENQARFTPEYAGKLLPVLMNDFVLKHGSSKIIPQNAERNLIASIN